MTEEEIKAMEEALEGARAEARQHLETIAAREERIGELEGLLAQAQEALTSREGEVAGLREKVGQAAAKYRDLVLVRFPEVPEELVQGATVEEVETSLEAAQAMVERVKKQLVAQTAAERVPVGAPPRTPPDLSSLSPKEKIAYALARR